MVSRVAQLQNALKKKRMDWLLVSSEPNIRWLTGESNLGATVIIPAKAEPIIITTEFERMRLPTGFRPYIVKKRNWWREISNIVGRGRVGYEDADLSVRQLQQARKYIKAKLVPASESITKLREVKTSDEVVKIKRALQITVAGMEAVRKALKPGITERELAAVAESAMRRAGAEWFAFDTIISSGPQSAIPHMGITDRKIRPHDLVIVDIGAKFDGWCADMTRTFCIKPGPKERTIYNTVLKMRATALKKIKVGQKAAVVDFAARDVARRLGLGKAFIHGLGHGVGVDIHESPSISEHSKDRLRPGMVFTIEPGLYFSGWGGVRIEDMFLLTASGPKLLTKFPHRLIP
ncbi:MAG: Xaa-Pro peptidase family protein [Candidatus Aenigmatarchaeota archaeon]